jgi:hypothetical protein
VKINSILIMWMCNEIVEGERDGQMVEGWLGEERALVTESLCMGKLA